MTGRLLVLGQTGVEAEAVQADEQAEVLRLPTDAPLSALVARGPYEEIVVAEPTRAVAWAWVENTILGGRIQCILDPTGLAAAPLALQRAEDAAIGGFCPTSAHMGFGPEPGALPSLPRERDPHPRHARTVLPLRLWDMAVPWFLAVSRMPETPRLARVHDDSGDDIGFRLQVGRSWFEITGPAEGEHRDIVEGGKGHLFHQVTETYRRWSDLGEPGWEHLGLIITPLAHLVVVDVDRQWPDVSLSCWPVG